MLCLERRLSACPTLLPYSLLGVPPHIRPIMAARRRGGAGVACHGHQPQQVCEASERLFNVPVIESYGMTEASMVTCNPLPPVRARLVRSEWLWAPRWPFSMRPGMYCRWVPLGCRHVEQALCRATTTLRPTRIPSPRAGSGRVARGMWMLLVTSPSSPVVLRKPSTVVEKKLSRQEVDDAAGPSRRSPGCDLCDAPYASICWKRCVHVGSLGRALE